MKSYRKQGDTAGDKDKDRIGVEESITPHYHHPQPHHRDQSNVKQQNSVGVGSWVAENSSVAAGEPKGNW